LVDVLGYDIGGANTKAAWLHIENKKATVEVASKYFPIWKDPQKLTTVLLDLKNQFTASSLDAIGVTMTAELSDAYQNKREGVNEILSIVQATFGQIPIFVLTSNAELISPEMAKQNPLMVASANWAATGWLLSKVLKNAIIVDVGSTSTSIIPVFNWFLAARGKTDLEKLLCGELVYTGSLRTNVASIVHKVPIRTGLASVSSELFATSGDVHLLLDHIKPLDFTSETADGRGRSIEEAMARLSRVVCADKEMLTTQEIYELAHYIYDQQIDQITEGLAKTYWYLKSSTCDTVPVVVTGLGKDFLARKATESVGVDDIIDLDSILPKQVVLATPAVGVALMTGFKVSEEPFQWK
jgi:probable H4MPT-linked C1 transfer pathway protein